MRKATIRILEKPRPLQRFYSTHSKTALRAVDTLHVPLELVDLDVFRHKAFIPENPIVLLATGNGEPHSGSIISTSLPAALKWFRPLLDSELEISSQETNLQHSYLATFGATILPYEYIVDKSTTDFQGDGEQSHTIDIATQNILGYLGKLKGESLDGAFHRFYAPLSLLLHAYKLKIRPRLYIAQAQIADLPKQLQDDLPTPMVVKKAGKGDVYDSNIWIGLPPTYTPLHKDPNPNLFMQLSGIKRVRIFKPEAGSTIFRKVQQSLGHASSSTFRGEEMMEGPERNALDEAVWRQSMDYEGYEATVNPGDALFIPKGWWHSFKSDESTKINASVNWWFR